MALFGADFDPTVPADASPRRDGAKWIRDIKNRLKLFANVYFDLETGKFRPGVLPSSVLQPTNAAGIWTKNIVDATGRVIGGSTPTTAAGLGILDVFDQNSIIPVANGGTGLTSVPAGGRKVLGGKADGTLAFFALTDTPSVAWTFDEAGQAISAKYNSPVLNPQPQVFVMAQTIDPSTFNGRIVLASHNLAGPTGLQGVMTIIGVKVYINGATWSGVGTLNFTNSGNTNNALNQLVVPESALVGSTRFSDTSSGKGIVTVGTSGSWPIPAGEDFVVFTGSNLPPTAGGLIDIVVEVQVT